MTDIVDIKKHRELTKKLLELNGKPENRYNELLGSYDYSDFILHIKHIPDAPGAKTARISASILRSRAGFPKDVFAPKSRENAARSFIARVFAAKTGEYSVSVPGTRGGKISIDKPGQEVLETSVVVVGDDIIEIRFGVELPVKRGVIQTEAAAELFTVKLPALIRETLMFENLNGSHLADFIETNEDAEYIRGSLEERGLVAFIADGSILPRRSRMNEKDIVPFAAPKECMVTFDVPNRGEIHGMGIPKGITVITGGCSHGKTTLSRALELGVYNHVFSDGREFVVTVSDAVGIRTDEGRRIENVNISPFIRTIATNIDTRRYTTHYAPPAVSLAANIMEALEIGTSFLLFDDETLVPGLIGRDACIQTLIPKIEEPMTPLVDILPVLRDRYGISSLLVNPPGDFFTVADTVLLMKNYRCSIVTEKAKSIAAEHLPNRKPEPPEDFTLPAPRKPLARSLAPLKEPLPVKKEGKFPVHYGSESIDVSHITQIVSHSQIRALARGIAMVYKLMDSSRSLKEAVIRVMDRIDRVGLDALSNLTMGDLAAFRAHELAAVINRMKELKVV